MPYAAVYRPPRHGYLPSEHLLVWATCTSEHLPFWANFNCAIKIRNYHIIRCVHGAIRTYSTASIRNSRWPSGLTYTTCERPVSTSTMGMGTWCRRRWCSAHHKRSRGLPQVSCQFYQGYTVWPKRFDTHFKTSRSLLMALRRANYQSEISFGHFHNLLTFINICSWKIVRIY